MGRFYCILPLVLYEITVVEPTIKTSSVKPSTSLKLVLFLSKVHCDHLLIFLHIVLPISYSGRS